MVELRADRAGVADAGGPVDDERVAHPAAVGVALVALQRRVRDLGPPPRIGGLHGGPADLVEAGHRGGHIGMQAVEQLADVEVAVRSALLAGAVVRHQHEQRVVEPAQLRQGVDQPGQLRVGVVEEAGVGLLQPGREPALVVGQVVPRLDAVVAGRQRGRPGHDAELLLAGQPLGPDLVPAPVVAAAVLLHERGRSLQRPVARTEGQVEEEGPVGGERHVVAHEAVGVVDQVLGEVVALGRGAGRLHDRVVLHEVRVELVGVALQEPVGALEALAQRPVVERPDLRLLVRRREVPLADVQGRVARVAQHLGDRGRRRRDAAAGGGEPGVPLGHHRHADAVVVAAGQQAGPGGRAERRRVEPRVAQATGRQAVDRGRVDLGAVAAEVGEADVVEHDRPRRWASRLPVGWPRATTRSTRRPTWRSCPRRRARSDGSREPGHERSRTTAGEWRKNCSTSRS